MRPYFNIHLMTIHNNYRHARDRAILWHGLLHGLTGLQTDKLPIDEVWMEYPYGLYLGMLDKVDFADLFEMLPRDKWELRDGAQGLDLALTCALPAELSNGAVVHLMLQTALRIDAWQAWLTDAPAPNVGCMAGARAAIPLPAVPPEISTWDAWWNAVRSITMPWGRYPEHNDANFAASEYAIKLIEYGKH